MSLNTTTELMSNRPTSLLVAECQEFEDLLDEYVMDRLTTAMLSVVENHLDRCAACRREVEAADFVVWVLLSGSAPPIAHNSLGALARDFMVRNCVGVKPFPA
jgi:hypothetical protein